MKVYIIMAKPAEYKDWGIAYDPIRVFSTFEKADKRKKEIEKFDKRPPDKRTIIYIIEKEIE